MGSGEQMKRALAVGVIGSSIALSSCYNGSLNRESHVLLNTPSFTLSESPDYVLVTLRDPYEIYNVNPKLFRLVKSRLDDCDLEILKKPCHMRELLETADRDHNHTLNAFDVMSIAGSKKTINELVDIVNSHYSYHRLRRMD